MKEVKPVELEKVAPPAPALGFMVMLQCMEPEHRRALPDEV